MSTVKIDAAAVNRVLADRFWQQKDLAEASGLSEATISNALNGHGVSRKTARILAGALGWDVCEIVEAS